jgi:glycosyltransferase involved in cell wall biosynthesis
MKKLISIGVPVRNEEENLPIFFERLTKVVTQLIETNYEVEILLNNNASTDGSLKLLDEWCTQNLNCHLYNFSSPVSFQASILELMKNSVGDVFVILQSDLQDPPELILDFVKKWAESKSIVAGVIQKRTESFIPRSLRKVFYFLLQKFSDGEFIKGLQDFYLLPKDVYTELSKLNPEGLFLRGHITSRFSNLETIRYIRADRVRGSSKFDFPKKYTLALDGILLFGTRFIRLIALFSLGIFISGSVVSLGLLFGYFLGFRSPTAGWTSLGLLLATLLSLFGISTSLILEYLIRIYRQILLENSFVKAKKIYPQQR